MVPSPGGFLLSILVPKWASLTLTLCTQHCVPVSRLHLPHQIFTPTCFSTVFQVSSCLTQVLTARTVCKHYWKGKGGVRASPTPCAICRVFIANGLLHVFQLLFQSMVLAHFTIGWILRPFLDYDDPRPVQGPKVFMAPELQNLSSGI